MFREAIFINIDSDPLLAPALRAVGFAFTPKTGMDANNKDGLTVNHQCPAFSMCGKYDSRILVPAWNSGSLLQTDPDHPFVACMMGLRTRRVLGLWRKGGCEKPHILKLRGSSLTFATPPSTKSQGGDISHHLGSEVEGMPLDHAAAALTVGYGVIALRPFGCMVTSKGVKEPSSAAKLAAVAAQIEADGRLSATTRLFGHAPGEHPFLYALSAIRQVPKLQKEAEDADPVISFRGKSGKMAKASKRLMESNSSFKDDLYRHIR